MWAGHAGDPFWIEPEVLHAVGHAFRMGPRSILLGGIEPGREESLLAGHTVYSIVLEVPDTVLLVGPHARPPPHRRLGRRPRSPPTRADGVRSIGWACQ